MIPPQTGIEHRTSALKHLRNLLLAGVLVIAPAAVTVWVLFKLLNFVDNLFSRYPVGVSLGRGSGRYCCPLALGDGLQLAEPLLDVENTEHEIGCGSDLELAPDVVGGQPCRHRYYITSPDSELAGRWPRAFERRKRMP